MRYGRQNVLWVREDIPDTDLIKYARVAKEIEYREKSDFPAKEVLSPITQSLFYFTEDEFIESKGRFQEAAYIHAAPAISTHSITRKRST